MSGSYNHSPWESTSVKAVTLEVNEPSDKVRMYDDFNNNASGTVASGSRFDHSGYQDVLAEARKQYDAWKASK